LNTASALRQGFWLTDTAELNLLNFSFKNIHCSTPFGPPRKFDVVACVSKTFHSLYEIQSIQLVYIFCLSGTGQLDFNSRETFDEIEVERNREGIDDMMVDEALPDDLTSELTVILSIWFSFDVKRLVIK